MPLRMILPPEGRQMTARAGANLSGGYLLRWLSGTDAVNSSGALSYAWDDIAVAQVNTPQNCVGVATTDAASGNEISFAQGGVYVLQAGSVAISGGFPIIPSGYGDMVEMSITIGSVAPIGRALSTATLLTGWAVCTINI